MKKFLFVLLIVAFVCTASTVYAAQKAPLGAGNLAVKLDWIKFTDGDLKDTDIDSGFYIGLEGYGEVAQNLYLGMESGYTRPSGSATGYIPFVGTVTVDSKLTYIPIELNLKYAAAVAQNLAFDIGAGVSYNYAKLKQSAAGVSDEASDWMFGGQFFIDLNYTIDQFFIGISGKYQLAQEFDKKGVEFNPNNWRLGGQLGVMF